LATVTPRDPASPSGGKEPPDDDRLARFDLTVYDIEQILRRGEAAAAAATPAHPVGADGMFRWLETVAALRGTLLSRGWKLDNEQNVARIVNPDRTIALVASAGDSFTGLFGYGCDPPRTARPRGDATRKLLYASLGMEPLALLGLPEQVADDDPMELWLLLYRRTRPVKRDETSVIRAEVSRPCGMNARGYVDEWLERIPAGEIPVLDHIVRSGDDGDEGPGEVDFDVAPKSM
jgi:hypothetical protein